MNLFTSVCVWLFISLVEGDNWGSFKIPFVCSFPSSLSFCLSCMSLSSTPLLPRPLSLTLSSPPLCHAHARVLLPLSVTQDGLMVVVNAKLFRSSIENSEKKLIAPLSWLESGLQTHEEDWHSVANSMSRLCGGCCVEVTSSLSSSNRGDADWQ